jgi:hypothetical protein
MEYPAKFKVCPNCGSESRIIEVETNEEISKGNLKVGTKIPVMISITPIFTSANTSIVAKRTVPMLRGFFDICSECGCLYCVEIQKGEMIVDPQFKRGDARGSPFSGNG